MIVLYNAFDEHQKRVQRRLDMQIPRLSQEFTVLKKSKEKKITDVRRHIRYRKPLLFMRTIRCEKIDDISVDKNKRILNCNLY